LVKEAKKALLNDRKELSTKRAMETSSKIIFGNSNKMDSIDSDSVDLIVTSPPYPMIKMWDEMFCDQSPSIEDALKKSHGMKAFELMHKELDRVWKECFRVLEDGCRLCINIGDQFARSVYYGRYKVIPIRREIIKFYETIGFDFPHNIQRLQN